MKVQENITRRGAVVWAQYELKLNQLDILFHFVAHAFQYLSEAKKKEFVEGMKLKELSAIWEKVDRMLELREKGVLTDEVMDEAAIREFRERQEKKLKARFRRKTHMQYAEWVNDGMSSAEILFRVTILEDFLKHTHAAMLNADTKIFAAAKPKRTITCEEVFAGSLEQFKAEQICREVADLDRQSMKQRVEYFAKHLDIDFGKNSECLIELSDIRNKIAHGNPLETITMEDTTLPLHDLQGTVGKIVRDAMKLAFEKGRAKHPRYFQLK